MPTDSPREIITKAVTGVKLAVVHIVCQPVQPTVVNETIPKLLSEVLNRTFDGMYEASEKLNR